MKRWHLTTGVALLVAVLALVWGYTESQRSRVLLNHLNANYNAAFLQLAGYVDGLEVMLGKGQVANSENQHVQQLADVWRQATAAKDNLARLPIQSGAFMRTAKFLTQTGDISYILAKKQADGKAINTEDQRRLSQLRHEASLLSKELHRIQAAAVLGNFDWRTIQSGANTTLRQGSKQLTSDEFKRVDRALIDYPTMQYDGPFSDHVDQIKPRGLTGPQVSQADAAQAALKIVDAPDRYVTRFKGMTRGNLVAYSFDLMPKSKGLSRVAVDVSAKGGHVVWATNTRRPGPPRQSSADADRAARAFLARLGYHNVVATYSQTSAGVTTLPYVPEVREALIYPDQVKVAVAMDRGEVVSFDALNYVMHHKERGATELSPRLTQAEARQKVNSRLKVSGGRLAVIPLEVPGQELLTWEFRATLDGAPYFVYIDAKTGREEKILKIVSTPQGTQTM